MRKLLDAQTFSALVKLLVFVVITTMATGVLIITIGNISFAGSDEYQAEFVDATGVVSGDDVRVAGVKLQYISVIRFNFEAHKIGQKSWKIDQKVHSVFDTVNRASYSRTSSAAV